ncbi:MAG: hypothetical protein AB4911_15785 [Oscillochloridaceae bacterium umkhey_bin13]
MEQGLKLQPDIRVWQDERLGQLWRVAYRDGDDELVVSFPDSEALSDFLAERLGLTLLETFELPALVA